MTSNDLETFRNGRDSSRSEPITPIQIRFPSLISFSIALISISLALDLRIICHNSCLLLLNSYHQIHTTQDTTAVNSSTCFLSFSSASLSARPLSDSNTSIL